jgi:hypothetical protein
MGRMSDDMSGDGLPCGIGASKGCFAPPGLVGDPTSGFMAAPEM